MRSKRLVGFLLFTFALVFGSSLSAQQIEYLDAKPMSHVVQAQPAPVASDNRRPVITWGADVATIFAEMNGAFKQRAVNAEFYAQNDFVKQVEDVISGKTPYLRGTMGMINLAEEALKQKGLSLRTVVQLSFSNGDDVMVVRDKIRKPSDLCHATIGLQRYGPHMDYVANILKTGGCSLSTVKFKWLRELTIPTYDTKGRVVDTVTAFQNDPSLDAVMVIIPDALTLTSGEKGVGTGAEGSVKGAHILLTTRTANKIIADVYAVREDYYQAHQADVEKFRDALIASQAQLNDLLIHKAQRQAEYRQLLSKAATVLFGSSQGTKDVEGLLSGGCDMVGYPGNVKFFSGAGTTRTFQTLTSEIQTSFVEMGFLTGRLTLNAAAWNFTATAGAATAAVQETEKFDKAKVQQSVEKRISVEPTQWAEKGTLFVMEINFQPNQTDFSEITYGADFKKALGIIQTYGGALTAIEGHADPLGILQAREDVKAGKRQKIEVDQMEQQAKNLSLQRSKAVYQGFIAYAKKQGIRIDGDETLIVSVGMGIKTPKYNPPKTEEEWRANRRVVFRIKQVEAELSEFKPVGK